MKKLIVILAIAAVSKISAQPTVTFPYLGTPHSITFIQGWERVDSGLLNALKDTILAPVRQGEQRFRIADSTLYIASSTIADNKWVKVGSGGGVVSVSGLSPLFTTNTPTTTPTFVLSNTTQYTVFGRSASGSGVPSYVGIDTTWITNFSGKVRSLFSGTSPITYSNGTIGIDTTIVHTSNYNITKFQTKIVSYDSSFKISSTSDTLYFRDYVNIKSYPYNCKDDNSTDNSSGLAAAIATGRPVFIPAGGTFRYSTSITLNAGQILFGEGKRSQLRYTGTLRAINLNDSSKVIGFSLEGNGKSSGNPFETGVECFSHINAVIQDMWIKNFGGNRGTNGGGGIDFATINGANSAGNNIINCRIQSCNVGINLEERSEYTNIIGGTLENNNTGFSCGSGNITMTGTIIEGNTNNMYFFIGTNNGHSTFTSILSNHPTSANLDINDISQATGLTFTGCQFYYGSLNFTRANNIRFENCNISSLDSVHIDSSAYIQRVNCQWGVTTLNARIPINLYHHADSMTVVSDMNYDTSIRIKWIDHRTLDTAVIGGPTSIGTPSSPTSTLRIGGSIGLKYNSTATSVGLDGTYNVIEVTATGQTITLPTAVGIQGRVYTIKLTASGSCTVATTSSQNIDASTTYSLSAQYKYVTVMSNNVGWIVIANNGLWLIFLLALPLAAAATCAETKVVKMFANKKAA